MPAMTIFTMSIKYLKEHFNQTLNNQTTGIMEKDIQYVITVPAIWNDSAKQFMREAAEKVNHFVFKFIYSSFNAIDLLLSDFAKFGKSSCLLFLNMKI
jgi:molecular chaperone DnaK (HSP70)